MPLPTPMASHCYHSRLLLALIVWAVTTPTVIQAQETQRLPDQALSSVAVAPGLDVTLFASEPMLVNPTNMDIDARGRVWVTEAYNYRMELNPNNPVRDEGDRIVILEDTDGDGRADTDNVFYQGTDINAALGIAVFGSKVFVSVSPHIFVFTDDDGDDVADRKEVLFSGIGGVQHDHGVHAFTFGPDGKLYFNFGNEGTALHDADSTLITDIHGNPVRAEGQPFWEGMVFRLNEDGTGLDVVAHNFRNNYEVALDAFGTMWQSDNDDDGNRSVRINYVMEHGNFGRVDEMTGASWRARRTNMHEDIAHRHWHQNDPGVVPNLLHTGAGSPTGIAIYEGRLLPEVFWDQMIHADAGPNVVRAYPVRPDGAGYAAEIVNIVEANDDPWFRPSDVTVAPDGSLFIADWYDPGVGGHQMGDQARGRIFRVAPPDSPYKIPEVDLSTPVGAADALKSPNVATRYLAWHALDAFGTEAEPALLDLWNDANPRYRARALWLLARLPNGRDHIDKALADANPDLRITALRAARERGYDLVPILNKLVDDTNPQVRREAALALRYLDAPEAAKLWTRLALQHDGQDRWYLEALGIGAEPRWDTFFQAWLDEAGDPLATAAGRDIVWRARTDLALPYLAELAADDSVPLDQRLRYFRAFDFHGDAKQEPLLAMLDATNEQQHEMTALILSHLSSVEGLPGERIKPALDRTLAHYAGTQRYLDLVDQYERYDQAPTLVDMALAKPDSSIGVAAAQLALDLGGNVRFQKALKSSDPSEVQAALKVLGRFEDEDARTLLEEIALDESRPLTIRRQAVQGMGRGWGGENYLVELLEQGKLDPPLVEAAAETLLGSWRGDVRATGARYLNLDTDASDLPPLAELADRTGDAARGAAVFERLCSSCHQVQGQGTAFGPDLSEIGSKLSKEAMYVSITNPSAGINFGYEGVLVTLNDGSQLVGYIANETADQLDLRQAGGVTRSIDKTEVQSRAPLDQSLMPAGLHHAMSENELVDLVEYLNSLERND